MDETLNAKFRSGSGERKMAINSATGTIRLLDDDDDWGAPYRIKPLAELYDLSPGASSPNDPDRNFMGLLIPIEETFVLAFEIHPTLTDGQVLAALDQLCMSPEGVVQPKSLAAEVQFALRVVLSVGDYSRQDVRHCLRKVKQSVARHNKLAGTQGYLNFITKTLTGK
jgi:hypothetical protein